jgi:hypothetical protein
MELVFSLFGALRFALSPGKTPSPLETLFLFQNIFRASDGDFIPRRQLIRHPIGFPGFLPFR